MSKNAAIGMTVVLAVAVSITLLIVALVTGNTVYLLVESAIIHLVLVTAIIAAVTSGDTRD